MQRNPEFTPPAAVLVYTTPTWPDCRQIKTWLDRNGIAFEERDLSNPAIMNEAKTRYGVRVAPVTVVGDWFTYGTFSDQKPRLERILSAGEKSSASIPWQQQPILLAPQFSIPLPSQPTKGVQNA